MAWEAPQIAVIAAGCAICAVAPELVRGAGVAFIFRGEFCKAAFERRVERQRDTLNHFTYSELLYLAGKAFG